MTTPDLSADLLASLNAARSQRPFPFGQPHASVVQMAYVVPDVESAARLYSEVLRIGPWFVRGPFTSDAARYRGGAATASATLAVAFSGHMQFELIAHHDDKPSVWREFATEGQEYGFHHYGFGTRTYDADVARLQAEGAEFVFTDVPPVGGRVGYLDLRDKLNGMVEVIEMTDAKEALYDKLRRAALEWDGTHPLRRMP